jgi:DNA-binding PadR family transcriptional regulator
MKIEDIFKFFESQSTQFLNDELAVCYIADVLVHGNSYGIELIQRLEKEYPGYRLSDTVLYHGLNFLLEEGVITSYWKNAAGRGRPRRMYQIQSEAEKQAQELSHLWQQYIQKGFNTPATHLALQSSVLEYSVK